MKKVLILGAGTYQIPLIEKAQKKGFHVIAASWSQDDPGMKIAHECWVVDTKDKEKILDLSRQHKIDGVLTTGTDVAIPAVGYICDALGLNGISYETARASTQKGVMQELFKIYEVKSAKSIQIENMDQAIDFIEDCSLPLVIKAPDSSGSRGVFIIHKKEELKSAFHDAFNVSRSEYVLVEDFIKGIEFGAQTIVLNKKIVKLICFNDTVTSDLTPVPIGHSVPFALNKEVEQQTFQVCESAVEAIGLENGICNIDLIYDGKEVNMLEIGARIGGTRIPEIIKLTYDIDLYDAALEIAFGKYPQITEKRGLASAILVMRSRKDGVIKGIETDPALLKMGSNVSFSFDYQIGEKINKFNVAPDRIGQVIATAENYKEAEDLCKLAVSYIKVTLIDNDGELINNTIY